MKVLFITDNFPPERNASATRVYERAIYWKQWGHSVTVITCAPNFPEGRVFEGYKNRWYFTEVIDGIKVVRVKTFIAANKGFVSRILDFLSFMVMAFVVGLFQPRPNVLVSTSPQFFAAVGAWALAKIRRIPYVFELSDLWPASIKAVGAMQESFAIRMVEKLELFLYRQSKKVIALTASFKEDLISRGIDANKIVVIRNGVDISRYQPKEKNSQLMNEYGLVGKFIVSYVGTHGMAHALENVVNTANLFKDNSEICFMFVGAGAERDKLINKTKELGLKNILFIPSQPKEVISDYWSLSDVSLIHLKNDPVFSGVIPSKMFECMSMGIPMIFCGPSGEGSEIILGENAGVFAEPESPTALAEVIENLSKDKHKLEQLAASSLQAAPKYSREEQARSFIEVLSSAAQ